MEITMANATGFDPDQHFAGAGFGPCNGFNGEACADLAENGGFHGFTQDRSL
jgi:hypothetical protein